jgi:hypothetical protein
MLLDLGWLINKLRGDIKWPWLSMLDTVRIYTILSESANELMVWEVFDWQKVEKEGI